ncbi:hypothetical protein KDW_06170 [Dictyobacter vulcani]|uniref:J domain-containing protein n=1 Tax=Dictyobacter vulcani TaxID=2607529 RepID=A0A5J4KG89_9CHLR|nr:GvpL/GvpF family gas vesicle protein [Dictyobacter vulcani]GER86455.1 hypothetical protein KDW_06170 [Dictyobacter vulcani]
MTNGIYIYGVIKLSNSQEPQNFGIDNPAIPRVFTVGFQDIAAVVSPRPLMRYDSLEQEQVVQDLAIHNFVIEKAMERFTIVPIKFGSMVEAEAEVTEFLTKGYTLLHEILKRMEGHRELDVVARWELSKVLPIISRENSQIREKQQEIAAKAGNASMEDKIILGQYIERALTAEKTRYHQAILQALQPVAEEVGVHDIAGDEMIFNAAFLLATPAVDAFYHALDALDQSLESSVNFRVVGPLPPYSFATIEVKRFDRASIDEAREILHLPVDITAKTVRDAYHQLAKEHHPDTNSEEDSREFQRINTAYTTLQDFTENGLIYPQVYQWPNERE